MKGESAKQQDIPWYALAVETVVDRLGTSLKNGLTAYEVRVRKKKYGPNLLPDKKHPSFIWIFFQQFKNPLIYLLFVAAAIALSIGHKVDAQVILVVLLVNALIGSFQENRAEISMKALKKMVHSRARVLRDHHEEEIDASELVPGDILLLGEGDSVGADARLVHTAGLQALEASLTGESLPIAKFALPLPPGTPMSDTTNMVYAGTHIAKGKGKAVVVATGSGTEIGKIALMAEETPSRQTPLEERIARFSRVILTTAIFVLISVVFVGLWRRYDFATIFVVALSQVVSMVPEGLHVAMTVALAVGLQHMARRGAIIRQLEAVETLGSASVICTDKTGTLTTGNMVVSEILLPPERKIAVTGVGYSSEEMFIQEGKVINGQDDPGLSELFAAAVLCNDAQFSSEAEGCSIGDPTEISLLRLAQKGGVDIEVLKHMFPRLAEIPFDSDTKMMAVLVNDKGKPKIFVKGAPENIFLLCASMLVRGERLPLDKASRSCLLVQESVMASKALRLLAFAVIDDPSVNIAQGWEALKERACFLGITGQSDPIRSEVKEAVVKCHKAGIRPVMVTGDHKATALAVADALAITRKGDLVIDGQELTAMSEEEFDSKLEKISVFARVHPAQKLKIVQGWQRRQAVVVMTGDGVNDAPALAKADVGIAMGMSGTEVAKEAAKMVITDDNFATIVHAVEEGRVVFQNLKKLLLYVLSTSITELLVLFAALLFGLPLPLAAVQILWINLVTDGVLSAPIVMQPREGGEMARPPIPLRAPFIEKGLVVRMCFMIPAMAVSTLFYFIYRLSSGIPFEQVQTGTFTVIAVCQWFNAINCQSDHRSAFKHLFSNYWLLGGLLVGNLLHMGVVFIPALNEIFDTAPMPLSEVFLIGATASLVLWAEELRKYWGRRENNIKFS